MITTASVDADIIMITTIMTTRKITKVSVYADIIMHINAAFLVLQQLGVGPEKGFGIVDASAVWDDFLPGDERAKTIASYMGAKVRLAFDPPQSSTAMEALKNTVAEMEFRLNIEFDKTEA